MNKINTIFFDVGGTLNYRESLIDEERKEYFIKILEIIGENKNIVIEDFINEVDARNDLYKEWSLKTWIELSEAEICSKWLFPKYDFKVLSENAEDLVLLYNGSKGKRIYRNNVKKIIKELKARGYKLGAITNTVSMPLVPGEFKREGISDFFDIIIRSSDLGIRKPDPRIFELGLKKINSNGNETVYVGDAPNRDVEGPKRADWARTVVLDPKSKFDIDNIAELYKPSLIIKSLDELLDIFIKPGKN